MPDMLVKLYNLKPDNNLKELFDKGVTIRRALPPEKHHVISWVKDKFSEHWASECEVAFSNKPVSCYIAIKDKKILGFGCYEATCRDFFGPTGVDNEFRGQGIGKSLLIKCLEAMKEMGYGYAIIGGAGPLEFYEKAVQAEVIEGSIPGIYEGLL
ncbi:MULTISPECIES: GNAT family N-acetyltransferase [Clostridium]|uniref:GNAT family N-acetyltransferase n=1 Tax=Clostridium TaxID=1485 RepID=UPI001C0C8A5C|nr:GNAT family N-acetyltransferase [Clostridium bowmanii]MBU3190221.1 GNAT family N-acetyltransferase [Clostridium bowmanii]MCA1074804.1 GNAT family N-acetyltransferase [Clostridium bowmanii]